MARKDCDSLISRPGMMGLTSSLGVTAALVATCLAFPAGAATVRMWSSGVVDGDQILVEHVAQVQNVVPALADTYTSVSIKPAPPPGRDAEVTLDELREALARAGANPAEFTVCGSTRCQVVRPLTMRASESAESDPTVAKYWWNGARSKGATSGKESTSVAEAAADEVAGVVTVGVPRPAAANTLEAAVKEFLSEKFANMGGRIAVRFSPNVKAALLLARPEYDFRVQWRGERQLGPCSLDVDVFQQGQIKQTIPMVVEVSLSVPVVMASRPINRGQIIHSEDIQIQEVDFFHLDRIGLTEAAMVVNQQARRFIRQGEMIYLRDLKPCPLVRQGDVVTVWSEVGGMKIKTAGKAMEGGTYGETIVVRNESSRQTFQAVVAGPQTVKVSESGRPVSLASSAERNGH